MLVKSYQVTLFLNLTALHFRGRWHSKGMTERAKYVVHFRFLLAKPSQATTPPALPKGRAQKTIKPHCARRNAPPLVLRTAFYLLLCLRFACQPLAADCEPPTANQQPATNNQQYFIISL